MTAARQLMRACSNKPAMGALNGLLDAKIDGKGTKSSLPSSCITAGDVRHTIELLRVALTSALTEDN
jgi:hypothetical protein